MIIRQILRSGIDWLSEHSDENKTEILYSHGRNWIFNRKSSKEWDACGVPTHTHEGGDNWARENNIGTSCCRGKCDSTAEGLDFCDEDNKSDIKCKCKKTWKGDTCEDRYYCSAEKENYKNNCVVVALRAAKMIQMHGSFIVQNVIKHNGVFLKTCFHKT